MQEIRCWNQSWNQTQAVGYRSSWSMYVAVYKSNVSTPGSEKLVEIKKL